MIFKYALDKVLSGKKTQTRRIRKWDQDWASDYDDQPIKTVVLSQKRVVFHVGKTYAVCPGRGKHGVARIRLLDIRREDCRRICTEDVLAEGFQDHLEFFKVWTEMHDPLAHKFLVAVNDPLRIHDQLSDRPRDLYDCWALDFEIDRDGGV